MNISISYSGYNFRRYSKPWIAIVTWNLDGKQQFKFGNWVGDAENGGDVVITANIGDIVCSGQKDTRKSQNSNMTWYIVRDPEMIECTKNEAYQQFKKNKLLGV